MDTMKFTPNIKELRQRHGFSQEELAEKTGLSLRTIQRIENGETEPRGDSLKRLSAAFGVSPDEIVDWTIQEDRAYLKTLNLSQLSFLAFAILGVIVPLILWIQKKDKVKGANRLGKKILNYQITWNILFFVFFTASLLFKVLTSSGRFSIETFMHPPALWLPFGILLGVCLLTFYSLILIIVNHRRLKKGKETRYPGIPFLK